MPLTKNEMPQPSEDAEIIIKEQLVEDNSDGANLAIPSVLILANRAGFEFLAQMFDFLATRQIRTSHRDCDDHQHVQLETNTILSDRIEFRTGSLTDSNREMVFRNYSISNKSAQRGHYRERAKKLLQEVEVNRRQGSSSGRSETVKAFVPGLLAGPYAEKVWGLNNEEGEREHNALLRAIASGNIKDADNSIMNLCQLFLRAGDAELARKLQDEWNLEFRPEIMRQLGRG